MSISNTTLSPSPINHYLDFSSNFFAVMFTSIPILFTSFPFLLIFKSPSHHSFFFYAIYPLKNLSYSLCSISPSLKYCGCVHRVQYSMYLCPLYFLQIMDPRDLITLFDTFCRTHYRWVSVLSFGET